ncbi:hypothetical protein [Nocardioides marmoriginsengisoli]|nr:hypothetical protein [Nocardioides marmoriginsengisoli]
MTSTRGARVVGPAVVVALACLALAPVLLARGFVLVGDMTFVPEQPWSGAWLGLDGSVPRAVPADAFVSAATQVLPGDLLQKAVLLLALVLAGFGMLRLVRAFLPAAVIPATGAAVLYLWNPWVLERLAIGHWGLLVGYAALPWVTVAALAVRRGERGVLAVVPALAVAAFSSPTGGIAAALVALVVVAERARLARAAALLGAVVVLNLPWLLPGLLGNAAPTDPEGVHAFAARADTPLGAWGSLLTFGGIWKKSIVPGERDAWLLVLLALALTVAGLVFLVRRARAADVPVRRLLALAGAGWVLAALPTSAVGADVVVALVEHVPGAGILRDSQKWLLLLVLAVCLGVGLGLEALQRWLDARGGPARAVTATLALLPVVLLPTFAWGISGDLDPVRYPAEWSRAASVLGDRPAADRRTVVLPWSAYQRFTWNGDRAALDPAIRFFPGQVVTNDDLAVRDRTVTGEDRAAARIGAALGDGRPLAPVLADLGIRYVLIERTAPAGESSTAAYPALRAAGTVLHQGPELELLDLGSGRSAPSVSYAPLIVVGDVLALVLALGSMIFCAVRRIRSKPDNLG